MSTNILDGKALANTIKQELAEEVAKLKEQGKRAPHLAAVLIGEDPASQSYVRSKVRSCERIGYGSTLVKREATVSEAELLDIVHDLNQNPEIDGFIVQLPLPDHIDEQKVTLAIDPTKDVDGFHPTNFGKVALGLKAFLPATPFGIMTMLERYNIDLEGKNCVVLGRSNIVGRPMSILLSLKSRPGNATVELCHSRTQNIPGHTRRADVLVVALGRPGFVSADMVKEGAVVIDVGINRVNDPSAKRGYRLVGDVNYEEVAPKCSYITPVPGGVGPMTVTALLMNTMKAFKDKF